MVTRDSVDLLDADYAAARTAFLQMKDDAWKDVDVIKKDFGETWDEVTGNEKYFSIAPWRVG